MMSNLDPEQLRLMEEMCIIIDENDNVKRPETKRNCHLMTEIQKGLLHRAFSVFIFSPDGKLLLQQRSDEKITFPGAYTNTCCSHPLFVAEEMIEKNQMGVRNAIQRKLKHELGIESAQVPLQDLKFLTRIHYLAASDETWGEHEIDYIFFFKGQVELNVNENEVKSVKYVTMEELKEMFERADKGEIIMTPWFRLIVETFLYKWWNNLEEIGLLEEQEAIHRL